MTLLERVVVSRKTPGDGRLMITAASAARLATIGSLSVERAGERAPGRLHEMTCTCDKGGGHGAHVHHFVESAPLKMLEPGKEVALELEEATRVLRVADV
jgi:hypothetical protein